jgi:hypothetical protein
MIRPATGPRLTVPVNEHDHILGLITAPVTMVEYGDYECTYCGQVHHVLKQVRQLLGHRLCFVFRHFPLTTVHPHAQQAAEELQVAHQVIIAGRPIPGLSAWTPALLLAFARVGGEIHAVLRETDRGEPPPVMASPAIL